ncbi:VNN1-like protein [Mya arenaria]|uniref:VNN1-like protein n=1 Tax=Mya arenaria TaxID=6604 RepID=A0ABY7DCK0_MYAAR|nr:pantetheinase-like [Mya arenaria]WAQ95028.1 VNN1-like protein [Mya arenaria]
MFQCYIKGASWCALIIFIIVLNYPNVVDSFIFPAGDARNNFTTKRTFIAAVYEHAVVLPPHTLAPVSRQKAVNNMMVNIRVYQERAKEAASQNADILVFPEDGVYGMDWSGRRQFLFPYLEYIPDPAELQWNPCDNPGLFPDTEIQQSLSCMAKENNLYVVANVGDKQPCNQTADPHCPHTGFFQYNTDVVYAPDGTLVMKYHKYNLFFENQFDKPPNGGVPVFETPFGRFGVFTCFDILFEHPPIDLITIHNVTSIAFPTAWMDAGPFFNSIQFHSAFAAGHRVNVLAANIHYPEKRFHGSGIYTPSGAAAFYYNSTVKSVPKLLVKEIPVVGRIDELSSNSRDGLIKPGSVLRFSGNLFTADLFHDKFNLVRLTDASGHNEVCHNKICCHASYRTTHMSTQGEHFSNTTDGQYFALGAFDGLHTYQGSYYIQVCTIIRCKGQGSARQCNDEVDSPMTVDMMRFELSGNFSTPFIYPEVLLQREGDFGLTSYPNLWSYAGGRLTSDHQLNYPLNVAALFGRCYDWD